MYRLFLDLVCSAFIYLNASSLSIVNRLISTCKDRINSIKTRKCYISQSYIMCDIKSVLGIISSFEIDSMVSFCLVQYHDWINDSFPCQSIRYLWELGPVLAIACLHYSIIIWRRGDSRGCKGSRKIRKKKICRAWDNVWSPYRDFDRVTIKGNI